MYALVGDRAILVLSCVIFSVVNVDEDVDVVGEARFLISGTIIGCSRDSIISVDSVNVE